MIAIAGASGRLGTLLVAGLQARGERVRVLTRDSARTKHLAGVEVAVGDVRKRETLDTFVAGARVVVSAVHGFAGPGKVSPASIDRDGNANLVDAAVKAKAAVVLMSVTEAAPDHPMDLMRMKYAAEEALKASGARYTIVRATAFIETWIEILRNTANAKHGPLVFGRGRNPLNFVGIRDVAALVVRVTLDDGVRGETLAIGGPEDITLAELAAQVAKAHGLRAPKHIPPIGLRIASVTAGLFKPELRRQTLAALAMDRMDGRFHGANARERYPDLPQTTIASLLV